MDYIVSAGYKLDGKKEGQKVTIKNKEVAKALIEKGIIRKA